MSSFPSHVENINDLKDLGFDVSCYLDINGNVSIDSWDCDELVLVASFVHLHCHIHGWCLLYGLWR